MRLHQITFSYQYDSYHACAPTRNINFNLLLSVPVIIINPFAELFPFLATVGGEASNDSETLTVRWSLPDQDCFNFSRFEISCMPLAGGGVASSGMNTASGRLQYALVRGLTPDTFYNCSVVSSFEGFAVTTITYTTRPIFTFPPSKPYGIVMYWCMDIIRENIALVRFKPCSIH